MGRNAPKATPTPRTKLTGIVQAQIVSYVLAGSYYSHACMAAGIAAETGDRWLKRGEAKDAKDPYLGFAKAIREAQGKDILRNVNAISQAATGKKAKTTDDGQILEAAISADWKAAAFLLERKYPKLWGAKVNLLVEEELEKAMKKLSDGLSPEEYDKVTRILGERSG